jgi:prepilin-type N-terminal cleavage/methylation domain-containing protein
MKPDCRRKESGFTLIEIMIVIVVVGILASIAIPNFLNLKDKAIWGTARGNLMMLRTALGQYAASSELNKYPVGSYNYSDLAVVIPKANLPALEKDSKYMTGSFSYSCTDGSFYLINVKVDNRAYDPMTASPSGITPDSYDSYVR